MIHVPSRKIIFLQIALVHFAGLLDRSWAQDARPKTLAELVRYSGTDCERLLYQGAQKEAKLVWYTTLTMHKEITKAFEAKFKGVSVEVYRAPGTTVATKLIQEAQAKRHIADAIESPFPTLLLLRENNLLMPFSSPHLATYPETAKDSATQDLVYTVL